MDQGGQQVGGRAGVASSTMTVVSTNLIGRAGEREAILDQLRRVRLLTLTGPGGVGKTRLALDVAERHAPRLDRRVWLVDLAAVSPGTDVAGETARQLDINGGGTGDAALNAVSRFMGASRALLVLDNCEHVLDGCAELVTRLLSTGRNVQVLATSREPLVVPGETVMPIEPLSLPDARQLFVERARQRNTRLLPRDDDETTIAELCVKIDLLPLAIELAAARVSAMSPSEICASLDTHRLELSGGPRLATAHHRSVRATVEWSYRLLDPVEQRGLRGLSVFSGSFDASAAEAVAPEVTLDVLVRLVDKSLVAVVDRPSMRTRYRLLETVRQFADELLVDAGEADDARARHLRHFSRVGDPPCGWPSAGGEQIVAALENDYGNVRAALDWAALHAPCDGMRLFASTADLFSTHGHADGWRLANLLLARCPTRDRCRIAVLITAGVLGFMQSVPDAASAELTEAVELAIELGEESLQGWATFFLGLTAVAAGRVEVGRSLLDAALAIHRRTADRVGQARATAVLGLACIIEEDLARARELVEDALAICVEEGDRWGEGHAHTYLGIICEAVGDERGATRHNRTAAERFRPFRDRTLLPTALASQASVLARRDPARALKVVAAARAIKTRDGGDFAPVFRARAERTQAVAAAAVGGEAAAMTKEGSQLDRDEACALAFGATPARSAPVGGLSAREQEVARLVADGMANKEIAAHLHLSVRTVESHVRSVLTKLGLTNRTQLATWTRERLR